MAGTIAPNIITDGLVLYLDASNNKSYVSGSTTWNDLSGNNISGSLISGSSFTSANGGAITFNGTTNYVDCGNSTITNLNSTNLTLACFFSSNNINAASQTLMSKAEAGAYSLELNVADSLLAISLYISGGYRRATYPSSNMQSNTPYYVVATYNNSQILLYLNGMIVGSLSYTGGVTTTSVPMCIGANPQTGTAPVFYLNGRIFSSQIYNRALSATEVLQNYNATKTRFGL